MDRRLLLFGSGTHFPHGSLPDCLAMNLRTGGLNGTIQPYRIFVADPQNDGPYEQRSKLTTNSQDEAIYKNNKMFQEGKMVSTEYTKGHGADTVTEKTTDDNKCDSPEETVHVVHINPYIEDEKMEDKSSITDESVKMSKTEFDQKVYELNEQKNKKSNNPNTSKRPNTDSVKAPAKKKKTHKFQLY